MPKEVEDSAKSKEKVTTNAPPDQVLLSNLVSKIPEEKQKDLTRNIIADYDNDVLSLADWRESRDRYYKLWACIREPKNDPWTKASNVCLPLLAIATNQFHARAYQAIFAPPGMVKTIPVGANDIRRAKNVEKYLNWQILHEMEEYEDVFDHTLLQLPINGVCFKKLYQSKAEKRVVSEYISALNLILPYRTTSLKSARRITQELWLHYDELQERDEVGLYENFDKVADVPGKEDTSLIRQTADESIGQKPLVSKDKPHLILECHRKHDLGDGRKPYIVTVDYDSQTLLRVASREFNVGAEKTILNYYTDYHFIPNPEGFYSFGFGKR
jgi:hypothetical protein